MRLRPGSVPWLLRHELRLRWRGKRARLSSAALAVVLILAVQAAGLWAARLLLDERLPDAALLAWVSGLLALAGMLMLAQALGLAVEALYERRDLAWLLTTPVPFRRVLAVRLAAVAAQVAGTWMLLLVGPVANGLALLGQPWALAAHPVLLSLALAATAAGCATAVLLVSVLGLRRARSVAGALSAIVGALGFLASQARTLLEPAQVAAVMRVLAPGGRLASLPARAMLGMPGPLLAVLAAGLGAAALAAWGLERRFTQGAALIPAAPERRASRVAASPAFRAGLGAVLLRKELRLLLRSPGLLGRALLQLVYVLPVAAPISRGVQEAVPAAMAGIIFVTGEVARLLVSATTSGDDAAELARSAPVPPRAAGRAKLLAAGLVLAALLALPAAAVLVAGPHLAPALLAGIAGVSGTAMLLAVWRPAVRRAGDLGAPQAGLSGSGVLNMAAGALWAAAAWLMATEPAWAALPAALVGGLVGVARIGRRSDGAAVR